MQLLQGYVLKIDIERHKETNFWENSYFHGNKKKIAFQQNVRSHFLMILWIADCRT